MCNSLLGLHLKHCPGCGIENQYYLGPADELECLKIEVEIIEYYQKIEQKKRQVWIKTWVKRVD